jgi:hypothetical protein
VPRIAQTPTHREARIERARHPVRDENDVGQRSRLLLPDDGTGDRKDIAFLKRIRGNW